MVVEDIIQIITKDLQVYTTKYDSCCKSHCFVEAAAVHEVISRLQKYLKMLRESVADNEPVIAQNLYVVTRCEEHSDYVEKVFPDSSFASKD